MDQKVNDIKFGLLTESELRWLIERVESEKEKRETQPGEYIDVVCCEDGSEGFYCKKEDFHKIPSDQLHAFISETLAYGSGVGFTLESMEKKEYTDNCARYEWQFGDGTNTEPTEEDEEDSDINEKYGR